MCMVRMEVISGTAGAEGAAELAAEAVDLIARLQFLMGKLAP
jgi:hypothetical protein